MTPEIGDKTETFPGAPAPGRTANPVRQVDGPWARGWLYRLSPPMAYDGGLSDHAIVAVFLCPDHPIHMVTFAANCYGEVLPGQWEHWNTTVSADLLHKSVEVLGYACKPDHAVLMAAAAPRGTTEEPTKTAADTDQGATGRKA